MELPIELSDELSVDAPMIVQVINALLSNALHHVPKGTCASQQGNDNNNDNHDDDDEKEE